MHLRTIAVALALLLAGGIAGSAVAADLPSDVYPDSRSRVPLVKREMLDADGQKIYDQTAGDSRSIVGLQGPGGIRLYASKLDALDRPINQYLRFNAGLDPKLIEIAILATAREMDQRFEWYAHEMNGRNVGVPASTIDIIRDRRPLTGLGEAEATLIELGREAVGEHVVSSATFATAQRLFGREKLIDYVALMGDYVGTGLLLTTFDQQLPAGEVSKLPILGTASPRARAANVPGTAALPSDVYANSRSRVPLITRDQLDAEGRQIYDDETGPNSRSIVGLQGPGGIQLYAPHLDALHRPLNRYLRFEAGLDPKLIEIGMMATAREMDQRFEWYAHEMNGLKVGVPPATIDIIRYRRPLTGLAPADAAVIELVREGLGKHVVSSATFATAERLFGRQKLIEYVSMFGDFAGAGLLLTTFDQQLPAGEVSKLPIP